MKISIIIDENYLAPGKLYKVLMSQYGHTDKRVWIPENTNLFFVKRHETSIGQTHHIFLWNTKILTIKYHTQIKGNYTTIKEKYLLLG